ncbi:MAG: bifunctional DNA primase/polymerase [Proteobacteria bacterium]|nr:bifunctional DNA primase/polymerase [Pseudomonadota bacterium]
MGTGRAAPAQGTLRVKPASHCLEAAIAYRRRGWSVIPVEPRAKRPLLAWRAFQARLATEAEIDAWYRHHPEANVAIVTGRLSGLVVLDVDPRHGGEASLAALEAAHGPLPATLESLTGGGGRHLYFRHPGGRCPNRVGLEPGLDLRGDGGCIVAPPSIHPSGRAYAWRAGRGPGEQAPASLPTAIRDHA